MEKTDTPTSKITEEQRKAIEELQSENAKMIELLDKKLSEYKKRTKNFDKEIEKFWEIMTSLEKSNSNYPLGHFSNYYYREFKEPRSESFITERGDKNPNFLPLTESDREKVESQLPNYDSYNDMISEAIEEVSKIIRDCLATNVFIQRLVGLPEKYNELLEANKNWRYPKSLSEKEYGLRGQFPVYDVNLTIKIPYHRQKMINYSALFNTHFLLMSKVEEVILILKSINRYLPFAEIIPAEKMPQTIIKVEANANNDSTSVGDSNKFEGDTVVGGGEIGE